MALDLKISLNLIVMPACKTDSVFVNDDFGVILFTPEGNHQSNTIVTARNLFLLSGTAVPLTRRPCFAHNNMLVKE